jgi:hypothetical protein
MVSIAMVRRLVKCIMYDVDDLTQALIDLKTYYNERVAEILEGTGFKTEEDFWKELIKHEQIESHTD